MRSPRFRFRLVFAALFMASCAGQPDHFYALSTLPSAARPPATGYATHVILSVSVPAVVDRQPMVLSTAGDRVSILEHERWAAPLSELVAGTLARDIEQRRTDVLVGDRGFDQPSDPAIKIKVDLVQLSARREGSATLEAHWRIIDAAAHIDEIGGEVFTAPVASDDYADVARAFSTCLSALADRLAEKLPAR
jgi:uncharacterized protein